MLSEVKKCADNNDIKGLHYIFVDCLDVDPTFEKYKKDYTYCTQHIPGFLENHTELTPFLDKISWNKTYWDKLKVDLLKNFSEKRFSHMREVAQVVYSDKVDRLRQARLQERMIEEKRRKPAVEEQQRLEQMEEERKVKEVSGTRKAPELSPKERQDRMIEEKRRELAEEESQKEREREKERRRVYVDPAGTVSNQVGSEDDVSKKSIGIVIAVVLIVMIVIIVAILGRKMR